MGAGLIQRGGERRSVHEGFSAYTYRTLIHPRVPLVERQHCD